MDAQRGGGGGVLLRGGCRGRVCGPLMPAPPPPPGARSRACCRWAAGLSGVGGARPALGGLSACRVSVLPCARTGRWPPTLEGPVAGDAGQTRRARREHSMSLSSRLPSRMFYIKAAELEKDASCDLSYFIPNP
ncbi:hypothetical protein HJG60_009442 [Phyllostomus discolor]|uniref:Uncharacterized protein n=1 Tax=Phyllostomus discolor TaxID=89673 RepID=A0A833YIH6_9CHIR|nr:hypothetical protein HJG60_009442 [Phyllostomus discolor]